MPTLLFNLLAAADPYIFAQNNGIRLKEGMIRVVMLVDEHFSSGNLIVEYDLRDYQKKNNLVFAYISLDNLKKICEENS
ncbi:MAG: hypothetical protein OEM01_04535, partial [Desulfobulbaceae bacterium]|nr:hypothetical protein [Desulfobulbaceae bacterium]